MKTLRGREDSERCDGAESKLRVEVSRHRGRMQDAEPIALATGGSKCSYDERTSQPEASRIGFRDYCIEPGRASGNVQEGLRDWRLALPCDPGANGASADPKLECAGDR